MGRAVLSRIAYWNKFGHPEGYLTRYRRLSRPVSLWWIDPQKEQQLAQAMRDDSVKLAVGPTEIRYWESTARQRRSSRRAVGRHHVSQSDT